MKKLSQFVILALHRATGIPGWSVKRPFQTAAKKMSRNSTSSSHQRNNFVKLSEPRQSQPSGKASWLLDSHATNTAAPFNSRPNAFANDLYRVQDISVTMTGRPRGRPIRLPNLNSRYSPNLKSRSSTNLAMDQYHPALVNYVKNRNNAPQMYYMEKVPLNVFEKDSYLKALELSRLPCETLSDPLDCHDLTQLFQLPFETFESLAGFPDKDCYKETVPLLSHHQSGYHNDFSPSPALESLSGVGLYQLDHPDPEPEPEPEQAPENIPLPESPDVKLTMRFIRVN